MGRFRRKSRGTWFPMLGLQRQTGEQDPQYVTSLGLELTLPASSIEPIAGVIPITYDQPQEPGEQSADTHGIADFIGNEYLVSRIVGQCFVSRTVTFGGDPVGVTDWPGVQVTGAFFVARAADGQSDFSDNVPVGWDTQDAWAEYSPNAAKNIRQPWMWRRTWLLGQTFSQEAPGAFTSPFATTPFASFPINNTFYPNMSDHRVDIKSRRRIHQDERLWFILAAMPLPNSLVATTDTVVTCVLDVRAFGQLRKARNSGSF